ncbi:ABC transporter permease [Methanolobus chelungpuianus]|uniref:ABC transporter substrate-binding protein n=1 Tax=Methanolobus chelungpuianus TaxID=502115 RepID=A0AAE3H9Z0_9EURY|nr:ABC transporter permease [Methanolobus chelungpuianus]MCQ6961948.1 ABC transporter substrate-binding protein [Methanolobus chelungpuianus]
MRYELFIALRHIKARKRQTILSVAAIGIAVMILMVSQAFMAGFTQEIYESTVANLPHVVVSPQEGEDYIHLYGNIVREVNSIEGVVASSPYLIGEASFRYRDKTANAALKGVVPTEEEAVAHVSNDVIEGDFEELAYSRRGIVIGDDLARRLGLQMGDSVEVSFPNANTLSLRVIAIYDTGTPADESLTYTSLGTAQDFYGTADVINGISLRLADFNRDREVASIIREEGYRADGWTQNNPEILQTLAIERSSNQVTLGFILLIASFGVVSTLNMVVMSKLKEIGILMAMGMSRSGIRLVFLLESGMLGLAGAVLGALAGTVIALSVGSYPLPEGVYGISSIPVIVRPTDVLLIITVVFLLNLIAGIYPAQRAASLDPVRAISTR